jgi:hypothetical protein
MSALTSPVLINRERAYWLSSLTNNPVHSTITTQEIDASLARFSTVFVSDQLTTSSLNASSFSLKYLDLSEGYISTLRTNNAFTSSLTWASDLSGGIGSVVVRTDPSGVKISGDPIIFTDLVYFTSTITTLPVSTIVDTDIFAQNGFFSTLSSGSISAGQIQARTASLSTLFVSSITTTDISGFEPETWSLYPTLNSSITFNGTNILSNVGNKLFFAGNEITDLSGGGANWSAFPAQQDVSMNNFSLRQLSTLQYQDGARLYSQTGNNLFYNGQPISYGNIGNAANWSFYPASTNVNMAGFGFTSPSKLNLAAPQFSTVVDQGTNIASVASYDITAQNGNRGQINMTANGGFNNGIFGSINLTANGATLGGVGTGGLITLTANTPLGSACNASSAIKFSAAGIDSYAGAVPPIGSLAGYNFIYGTGGVNIAAGIPSVFPNIPLTTYLYGTAGVTTESTFYVPEILPYWNGITTPPDLVISGRYIVPNLAQVYLALSNVKLLSMDAGAVIDNARILNFSNATGQITNLSTINGIPLNQIQTPSNILCSNITVSQSTVTNSLFATSISSISSSSGSVRGVVGGFSSLAYNYALGLSTETVSLRVRNINLVQDISGISAGGPITARILGLSTINSFNVSTSDLWVSSINGAAPGGGGGGSINNFSTLFASSLKVSSISGYIGDGVIGSTIFVEGGLSFTQNPTGNPPGGRFLTNLRNIFSLEQNLLVEASTTTLTWAGGVNPQGYVRLGGGGAYDTYVKSYGGEPAVSTAALLTSSIVGHPTAGVDISGNLFMKGSIDIPQANWIGFNAGADLGTGNLVNTTMPCFTNPGGGFGSNLGAVAANQFYVGSGTGAFGAAKLYCDFPGDNWGVDIIDANGSTLFETINCYDTGGVNFQTNLYGVSSIVGYTDNFPGAQQAVGVQGILTADQLSTTAVKYTSTVNWYQSNTAFNYPLVLEHDAAGNLSTSGAALRIIGHSFQNGAAVHELQMGWRSSDAANFITAVWPGQNLEDLSIEAAPLKVTDGTFSTIFSQSPYALQTTQAVAFGAPGTQTVINAGIVSTPSVLVSTINGYDPRPALTNNLCLSTMNLYAASTTLMYWDTTSTSDNINTSGYDVVVGVNGNYKIGCSFQFLETGAPAPVEFFILKNDTPIVQSGGIQTITTNQELITYFEGIEKLVNGDKIQIGCFTNAASLTVSTINGNVIQSPSAILTMYKLDM